MSKPSYILSAKRTPVGAFLGSLSTIPATSLGASCIKSAVSEAKIKASDVDEVIMGHVLTAGTGQAPARQALIEAGLSTSTPALTINKVCGSGLKAVILAHDMLNLNRSKLIVAGGQESMSLAPHILRKSRSGFKMGTTQLDDTMLSDGLTSPFDQKHMGVYAEMCAKEYDFSREEQDKFAIESYKRAQTSVNNNYFKNEICPIEVKLRKETKTVDKDDEPFKANFEKIPKLRPAFDKEGTITAANASKINDGAAALVLCSQEYFEQNKPQALAKVIDHSFHAHAPEWFTTAPTTAIAKLLKANNLKTEDIDLFEINEAFSAVTMSSMKELSIPRDKVNVNGGAVALGHPIGASGARILTSLVHALHTHNKKMGVAAICLGGGEAVAVLIERV